MKLSSATTSGLVLASATLLTPSSSFSIPANQQTMSSSINSININAFRRSSSPFAFRLRASNNLQQQQQQQEVVVDEVRRLKIMAAKLREEAAELEASQQEERAFAAEKNFEKFDTNKDGELSLDELKAGLEKTFKMDAIPEEHISALMEELDVSGDGRLQKTEVVGVEQFRSRLERIAQEDRRRALEASKAAQKEAEIADLKEKQLEMVNELVNDEEPTTADKALSTLAYVLPLMDSITFGQFLLAGHESNPAVAALALLYGGFRTLPLGTFFPYLALSSLSSNLSINRLVRYNMQQAIYLDFALFVPGLIATLSKALNVMPEGNNIIGELGSDAVFVTLLAAIAYSSVSSLLGKTPDKIPFISDAVNNRLPTKDMVLEQIQQQQQQQQQEINEDEETN